MITIQNTDLGNLSPIGLGSMKSENTWDKAKTYRIFDTFYDNGGKDGAGGKGKRNYTFAGDIKLF